jgi:hypothetical protein
VVTEYHFHDQNSYLIEVDYFTTKELRTQFEQLLSAYREHEATIPAERLEDLGLDGLNGNARESFENIDQCSDRLKKLTSETEENEQTCLWPFIRTLKFV